MIRAYLMLAAVLAATSASAQDFKSMQMGQNMGRLIGSESYCGLTFDQAAIESWIEENADPGDLNFGSYIELGITGEEFEQDDRSDSAKTAHCATVRRTAAHLGLVEVQ